MNRVSAGSGMASILMPSLGTVMLWQALAQCVPPNFDGSQQH